MADFVRDQFNEALDLIGSPQPLRLTVELPVSSEYLLLCNETKHIEFTHTRYTALTETPDDFGDSARVNGALRQNILNRDIELFVIITLYNEDDTQLLKTLRAVFESIAYLCHPKTPRSWGPNGWTNVVTCIVADGASKVHRRVFAALNVLGIFPHGIHLPDSVNDEPVQCHLFEFTTQICLDETSRIWTFADELVPMQMIFCLKSRNLKKVSDDSAPS
jgi:chitin synthase